MTNNLSSEQIILVDEQDRATGQAEKMAAHREALLHRAFSVFLLSQDEQGMPVTLLQQRCLQKYHCGGLWTNSCCSHPRVGEKILAAARRRLGEELGITAKLNLINIGNFIYRAEFDNGLTEHEFDHVVIAEVPLDLPLAPVASEVMATKWVSLPQLAHELQQNPKIYTPWFGQALALVSAHLQKLPATSTTDHA